jgi:hypothetical protein
MKNVAILFLLGMAVITYAQADLTITPTKDGLQIVGAGGGPKLTLNYPVPSSTDQKKKYATQSVEVKDNTAKIKYEGDGEVDIAVDQASGVFTVVGQNMPEDVGLLIIEMPINLDFALGGTYQIDDKAAVPFPKILPNSPNIFSGIVNACTIRAKDGKGLKFITPGVCYQQLADMRKWKWPVFKWMTCGTYKADNTLLYQIEDAGPAPAATSDAATTKAAPAKP